MKIKFLAPSFLRIKLYKKIAHTFIIFQCFQTRFFFKLSSSIKFIKKQNNFFFVTNFLSLYSFYSLRLLYFKFSRFLDNKKRSFCKKLFLKGLGFKVVALEANNFIELKIGFSHFVKIFIPVKNKITLYIHKNRIVIEGYQKDKVGNFANKIKSFRIPDAYKGKGIWYKKESKILKEVKKA